MNQDFSDLLAEFNAQGVEYLVVGGHALAAHGYVRATKDFDVWVRPSAENALRVLRALAAFGSRYTIYLNPTWQRRVLSFRLVCRQFGLT